MYFKATLLLIVLISCQFVSNLNAFALESVTESAKENGVDHETAVRRVNSIEKQTDTSKQNIGRMYVHPSEIQVPTQEQITTIIGAVLQEQPTEEKPRKHKKVMHEQQSFKSLTYRELAKLLASWQLTNEKNFYDIQTTQANEKEEAAAEISTNFLTSRN